MKKILVVDDNDGVRDSVEIILEAPNRQIFLAANGLEGIDIFKKERPDLLITDVEMPGMAGYEILDFFKAEGWQVKAIAISASQNIEVRDRMMGLGCRRFLEKPLDADELNRVVDEILEE